MIYTRLLKGASLGKTVLIFGLGAFCGAGLTWLVCWSAMSSLMGIRAQSDAHAIDAAGDAFDTAQTLSFWRLGETAPALQHAEIRLDAKTIEAAGWMKGMQNPQLLPMCKSLLAQVKAYRAAQPSQTAFKTQAAAALSGVQVPRKNAKRDSAIARFYST